MPALVGVPVMAPSELIVRPVGRPLSAQVKLAPDWVSLATKASVAMGVPEGELWAPGLLTLTVTYVNRSPAVLALVPAGVVMVTGTRPGAPPGDVARIWSAELTI